MFAEPHASWIATLDRIEQTIAAALEQTEDQSLTSPEEPGPSWNSLALFEDHLGSLEDLPGRAEASAAETEALLAIATGDLQTWLEAVATVRARVMNLSTVETAKP
jgi:hypothetical protein